MIGGSLPPVISPWIRRIAVEPLPGDVHGACRGHRAASSGTDAAGVGVGDGQVVGQARDPEDLAVVVGQSRAR